MDGAQAEPEAPLKLSPVSSQLGCPGTHRFEDNDAFGQP